jgi:hypothetical protein
MNPVNSRSVPATIGGVHATTSRVHVTFSRVPTTVSQVPTTVGRVPLTVGRRRGEIAAEYHTCLTPYRVKPGISNMFHKWIGHVRWTLT